MPRLWGLSVLVLVLAVTGCSNSGADEQAAPLDQSSRAGRHVEAVDLESTRRDDEILRLRRVSIMDPHGFARPVVARTFLAPINWSVKGGVRWTQSRCLFQITETHAVVEGPEGNERFEVYPDVYWQWSQDPIAQQSIQQSGCIVAPPMAPRTVWDAVSYVMSYVTKNLTCVSRIVLVLCAPRHDGFFLARGTS